MVGEGAGDEAPAEADVLGEHVARDVVTAEAPTTGQGGVAIGDQVFVLNGALSDRTDVVPGLAAIGAPVDLQAFGGFLQIGGHGGVGVPERQCRILHAGKVQVGRDQVIVILVVHWIEVEEIPIAGVQTHGGIAAMAGTYIAIPIGDVVLVIGMNERPHAHRLLEAVGGQPLKRILRSGDQQFEGAGLGVRTIGVGNGECHGFPAGAGERYDRVLLVGSGRIAILEGPFP